MNTDEILLREHILKQAVASIPKGFLLEVQGRFRRAYLEEYSEVQHSMTTLAEQRLFKLCHNRCFRMDWELSEAARAHGLNVTTKELPLNKWHHTYVTCGAFGLTQSYIPRVGDLPHPARFRESLAAAANCPRLPLDEPEEIYSVKDFYGLLAHTPVGRCFSEAEQKLGTLMLCVPDRTMKSWALSCSVPDLVAMYPEVRESKETGRTLPTWKAVRGVGSEEK